MTTTTIKHHEFSRAAYCFASVLFAIGALYIGYVVFNVYGFLGQTVFYNALQTPLSVQNTTFGTLQWLLACVGGVFCLVALFLKKNLRFFFFEVGDELARVAWPSLKEAQKSTLGVIVLITVVGFFLFFADSCFAYLVRILINSAASF